MNTTMPYPTEAEVLAAEPEQLARWNRFLDTPGTSAAKGTIEEFERVEAEERRILLLITNRLTGKPTA